MGQASRKVWLLPVTLAVAVLAYLPVLLIYLPQLWSRPYYRFFPFAFLATFVLAVMRADRVTRRTASRLQWAARAGVFLTAELCLIAGIRLGSPWPCFVAFVLTLGVILDFWRDAETHQSLARLILPLILVIRPPLHLDETIVRQLQTVTSQLASVFLSTVQVDHLLSGNVIEPISGGPLLVEEACSGVQSLFTLMLIAAFLSVYRRYTLLRSLLLVASSVVWALLMNVYRVVTIVLAQTEFNMDLSTGWQHEAIGYTGILLAVVLLLSTDRLLSFLLGGISDEPLLHPSINPLVSCWNWLVISPEPVPVSSKSAGRRSGRRSGDSSVATDPGGQPGAGFRRHLPATALTAALVTAMVTAIPAWGLPGLWRTNGAVRSLAELQTVDASWLDVAQLPGCRLLDFSVTERGARSQFGQYSDEWMVAAPFGNVLHSMDHVFDTWHNLTACYRGIGWQLIRFDEKAGGEDESPWPVAYAEFVKPTGEHAYLCFSLFTTTGQPILPEGETGGLAGARRRLRQSDVEGAPVVQVQSLNESLVGLSDDAIDELLAAHRIARRQLRDRVVRTMQDDGSGDSASEQTRATGGAE